MMPYYVGIDGGGTKTSVELRTRGSAAHSRAVFGPLNCNSLASCPTGRAGRVRWALHRQRRYQQPGCLQLYSGYHPRRRLHWPATNRWRPGHGAGRCLGPAGGHCADCRHRFHLLRPHGRWSRSPQRRLGTSDRRRGQCLCTADGRAPATALTELIAQRLGAPGVQPVIRFTYAPTTTKKEIAALAPLLDPALQQGDAAAQAIIAHAADELTQMAAAAMQPLGLQTGSMALLGSVLQKNGTLRAAVITRLTAQFPTLTFPEPVGDAADGAAVMAENS